MRPCKHYHRASTITGGGGDLGLDQGLTLKSTNLKQKLTPTVGNQGGRTPARWTNCSPTSYEELLHSRRLRPPRPPTARVAAYPRTPQLPASTEGSRLRWLAQPRSPGPPMARVPSPTHPSGPHVHGCPGSPLHTQTAWVPAPTDDSGPTTTKHGHPRDPLGPHTQ